MPNRLLVANWKLNKTVAEARAFLAALRALDVLPRPGIEVAIAPPLTALYALAHEGARDLVTLAAQAAGPEQAGAFTGDVSPRLLADVGARFALVGHSEARRRGGEDDPRIAATLAACWQGGVTPILCLGEPAAERARDLGKAWLAAQISAALGSQRGGLGPLVVAYEPVWAIGAAKPATLEVIEQTLLFVRAQIGEAGAIDVRYLYGGGVAVPDVAALMRLGCLDGLLVGKASLDPAAFGDMVVAASEAS